MITVRQLEILAAVMETGSFRKCALKLDISPVSVSEHMRALEAYLGAELFVRARGGAVTPTDAGNRAFEGVAELLTHVYDFSKYIVGERGDKSAIRIAMHGFMMRNLAADVTDFNLKHEQKIELISDDVPATELHHRVMSGDLDAAYFYAVDGQFDVGHVIAHDRLAIFVSHNHPLAKLAAVSAEQLSEVPLVSLSRDKPLRKIVDETLLRMGISQMRHVVETGEFGLILSSLHRNLGYTCMFEDILDEEQQSFGLKIVNCKRKIPPLQIRRITRRTGLRFTEVRNALSTVEKSFENLKIL